MGNETLQRIALSIYEGYLVVDVADPLQLIGMKDDDADSRQHLSRRL